MMGSFVRRTFHVLISLVIIEIVNGQIFRMFDEFSSTTAKIRLEKEKVCSETFPSTAVLNFEAFGRNFSLKIWQNKGMFSSNYNRIDLAKKMVRPFEDIADLCQYEGQVMGSNKSYVAVDICRGLRGIFHDGQDIFAVDGQNACVDGVHEIRKISENARLNDLAKAIESKWHIETVLVLDPMLTQQYPGNAFETSELMINIVNVILHPLNIQVVLMGSVISDEMQFSEMDITQLVEYRKPSRVKLGDIHDLTIGLIGASDNIGQSEGRALLKGMCVAEYSVALIDMRHSIESTAQQVVHSLGHAIGLGHNLPDCVCQNGPCIMSLLDDQFRMQWSQCSMSNLRNISRGLQYSCLLNRPRTLYDVSITSACGNGKVEAGEECDCGKDCQNQTCCDGSTCKLIVGAACSAGDCCDLDACQLKEAAVLCRPATGECDLEEYCDGSTSTCPVDAHIQDGTECLNGKSYCYGGKCGTYDLQCKQLWGEHAEVAADLCFHRLNMRGDNRGHCGHNAVTNEFEPCSKSDVKCGMIFCSGKRNEYTLRTHYSTKIQTYIQAPVGWINTCASISFDLGLSVRDPGMVQNGLKCGQGHTCMNGRCVDIKSLNMTTKSCSNHGVVNNYGECHCSLGYAPPDCSDVGPGGSVTSGPASIFLSVDTTTPSWTTETSTIQPESTSTSTTEKTTTTTESTTSAIETTREIPTTQFEWITSTTASTEMKEEVKTTTTTSVTTSSSSEMSTEPPEGELTKETKEIEELLDSFLDDFR